MLQVRSFQVVSRVGRTSRSPRDLAIVANSYHRVQVAVADDTSVFHTHSLFDVVLQNIHLMECTERECILSVHDFNPGFGQNMYMVRPALQIPVH